MRDENYHHHKLKRALDTLLKDFDSNATLNDINLILSITGDENV